MSVDQSQTTFRGVSDPPSLPGSEKHQKIFLSENSFAVVSRHTEHEYEWNSVGDHFQRGHVTTHHCRGKRNMGGRLFSRVGVR